MKEVLYIERFEQADALFKPQRVEVLRRLAAPHSCTEVAAVLGQSPQRVYYHVKKLLDADLVTQVAERRVRGIHEGVYQASAKSYWLSPQLVGVIGRRRIQDELSLGYLLHLLEDVQADLARLDRTAASAPDPEELPTLGISGEIRLPHGGRQAFLDDLRATLQELFTRHGGAEGDAFRLAVACYPKQTEENEHA